MKRQLCPVCKKLTYGEESGEYDIPCEGVQGKKLSPDMGYCFNCNFVYEEHINHSLEEQVKKYRKLLFQRRQP